MSGLHPARLLRAGAWAAAGLALAAVFLLYTRPTVLVSMAEQFWACVH